MILQQKYYGEDVGEFTPDELRSLADLLEIPNLRFNPLAIIHIERNNPDYEINPETGEIWAQIEGERFLLANLADFQNTETRPEAA